MQLPLELPAGMLSASQHLVLHLVERLSSERSFQCTTVQICLHHQMLSCCLEKANGQGAVQVVSVKLYLKGL